MHSDKQRSKLPQFLRLAFQCTPSECWRYPETWSWSKPWWLRWWGIRACRWISRMHGSGWRSGWKAELVEPSCKFFQSSRWFVNQAIGISYWKQSMIIFTCGWLKTTVKLTHSSDSKWWSSFSRVAFIVPKVRRCVTIVKVMTTNPKTCIVRSKAISE